MKIGLFNISNFCLDGGAMFGVVPKAIWSREYPADDKNLVVLSLNTLVVETGGHVILVDAGYGDKQDEKFFRHLHLHGGEGLEGGLRNLGYTPNDITDLFLTHLHADHCGGCLRNDPSGEGYVHLFPNATYHVSREQWEWALKGNLREESSFLKENFVPLSVDGRLHLVDEESMLFDDFHVRICHGHTPGLMYAIIKYKGTTIVYAGDLIPTSAHIPLIWNTSYDIESLKTIDEKRRLLDEAVERNYVLVFQHDKSVECATLQTTVKGVRIQEMFTFDELIKRIG